MNPSEILIILGLVQQYGPSILTGIKTIMDKKDATIADVDAVFAGLRPYAAFEIPAIVPQKPV